jgi:hypothetical protein
MPCWKLVGRVLFGGCSVVAACNGGGGSGASPPDSGLRFDSGPATDSAAPGDASPPADSSAKDSSSNDSSAAVDSGSIADSGAPTDGAPSDGAASDGAVSCGTSIDAGSLPYKGIVELSRITAAPAAASYGALAQIETTASAPPSGCGGMQVGACCYEMTGTATPSPASAGAITITDGTSTLATLMPPGYTASNATDATLTWTGGTTLSITAAGATVDAFSTSIVAPGQVAGLSPALTSAITVPKSSDFVVSWTPGKRACLEISFGLTQGTGLPHIGCAVDDSAGTLTVPASLLGMFTATSGTAVLERIEGKHVLSSNADIGIAAIQVIEVSTTYTP